MTLLLLLPLSIAACGGPDQDEQPDLATVDTVDIQIMESFPVQVNALVKGNLPDGCTLIDQIDQQFDPEENAFWIKITTKRSPDEICTQALVPFEEVVSLDVYGLPAGTYVVDVNGVRETFTLDVDNTSPEAELSNPASAYCEEQGYRVEIRTDEEGNQYGVCIFPDGSECEEWAFFRGECGPQD
jgi:inhibitor of cysteine peptidase